MSLVLDTSALVSLIDASDRNHPRVRRALEQAISERELLLIPVLVLGETEHVLERDGLERFVPQIVQGALDGQYRLECPTSGDLQRALAILTRQSVGLTDASVAALAERSGRRIATLDRRDFDRLRTSNGKHFSLVP